MTEPANSSITIYHNPACGTWRNTLALMPQQAAFTQEDGEVLIDAQGQRVVR